MPRQRKPNSLKLLHGTDEPGRAREEADYPAVEGTDPPAWVLEGEATLEWNARIVQLKAAGVLTSADLTMLGVYCNMFARAVMKWDALGEPTAAEITQLRMMANEFGFTPASRSKAAKAGAAESANPFAKHDSRTG